MIPHLSLLTGLSENVLIVSLCMADFGVLRVAKERKKPSGQATQSNYSILQLRFTLSKFNRRGEFCGVDKLPEY